MKCYLVLPSMGDALENEIDEETFLSLKTAMDVLSNCLAMEKKYEILLSNYLELEQQILQVTSLQMIRGTPHLPHEFYHMVDVDIRLMLDLRLVNLLTSARLYLDQLSGHLRDCLPNRCNTDSIVSSFRAAEYDSKLEYRFMEALRNHVQHRGLAVHDIVLARGWTELQGDRFIEYTLRFASLKSQLEMEGKFKQQVLDEIPERVDLKLASRSYIESLSNVHIGIRELIAESVEKSRKTIEDVFLKLKNENEIDVTWLEACQFDGSEISDRTPITLRGDDIRLQLQSRNHKLTNLQKRFATNR